MGKGRGKKPGGPGGDGEPAAGTSGAKTLPAVQGRGKQKGPGQQQHPHQQLPAHHPEGQPQAQPHAQQQAQPKAQQQGVPKTPKQDSSESLAVKLSQASIQSEPGAAKAPKQKNKYKPKETNPVSAPIASSSATGESSESLAVKLSQASIQSEPGAAKAPKQKNKYKPTETNPVSAPIASSSATDLPAAREVRSPSVTSSTSSHATAQSQESANIPSAAAMKLAPNKGVGTCGTKIMIDVNYLALNIQKLVSTIYHYDVNIEPNMPKRNMPNVFEEFRKKNFPTVYIAFDGRKNAFSPKALDLKQIKERKIMFQDEESFLPRAYMVNVKEVKTSAQVDMKALHTYDKTRQFDQPARALTAIEIVLKSVFLNTQGVGVGRAFYRPLIENGRTFDLGDNYDLWTGLFQSTVLGSQPYLNVDIAHKAFPRPIPLLQMLTNMRCDPNRGNIDYRTLDQLKTGLKGLRIRYEITGHPKTLKSYKFNDFGLPANKYSFKTESGAMVTIADYMKTTYGVSLKYPNLPSVWVGHPDKKTHMPLEFCAVASNQAVMKKCTEMQTRNMIKQAATSTDVRRKKIMDLLRNINHNASPTLQQFGVSVANEFSTIQARVLIPPTLEYAGKRTVQPKKGVWEAAGTFLYPAVQLTNWSVLILDQRVQEGGVREFVRMIASIGANYNMQISSEARLIWMRPAWKESDIDKEMGELKKNGCVLLFCIISNFGDGYARVKQAAEIRNGILTQCIKENTITRKGTDRSTISNILLKVNAKLNGTNHKFSDQTKLPIQKQPHMVIGADVTHPSPDQVRIPSVVGVSFSHDANSFRYRMAWRLQNPKQEMIQDLEEILIEQLHLFQATNKILPRYLFYYRDGVSEGQFQEVMRVELMAMYRACARIEQSYKPKIVFVVVQKRHHTRFFPKVPNRADRNNNVEPGTIVDTQITHPNETQFFLVSHASIQGVAKPTKYCLLHDDANMTINDLETFTYNLCHMFTRCNRAVSYPAPTYYAHLAAYRGRVYIEGKPINMDKLEKEYNDRRTSDLITRVNPMYFV